MWRLNELLVEPPHVKKLMVHLILQFDTIDDDSVSGGRGARSSPRTMGKREEPKEGGGTIEKEKKTTLI